jgi:hypothetical protein
MHLARALCAVSLVFGSYARGRSYVLYPLRILRPLTLSQCAEASGAKEAWLAKTGIRYERIPKN